MHVKSAINDRLYFKNTPAQLHSDFPEAKDRTRALLNTKIGCAHWEHCEIKTRIIPTRKRNGLCSKPDETDKFSIVNLSGVVHRNPILEQNIT